MRSLFALLCAAAPALPVLADGLSGYRCENLCPLAELANGHRAYGDEAAGASTLVLANVAARVASNLSKI